MMQIAQERCLLEAKGCESRGLIARMGAAEVPRADQSRGAQLARGATGFTATRPKIGSRMLRARSHLMRHAVFLSAVMAGSLLALYSQRTPAMIGVPYEVQQLFWRLFA